MKVFELKACPLCASPVRWCGENEPDPEDNHVCHHIVCTNEECKADFDFQIKEWTEEDEDLPLEEHFDRLRGLCAERFNRRTNGASNSR